jgi:ADP-ribosyl-[dinitrogen reductase] hydrolase
MEYAFMHTRDRYRGALLGLAAGDALGTTLEFKSPGSFEPIHDMVGGGHFNLAPGKWTDDMSMALCLAESLIKKQGFDARDQMDRYCMWYRNGHLSSTGRCFDIGMTVERALRNYETSGDPFSGSTNPASAGNGSLMRLAPIPLAFRGGGDELWNHAVASSATTHGAQTCLDACGYYSFLIDGALAGKSKDELLNTTTLPLQLQASEASSEVRIIASGSYQTRQPPDIKGTGYVIDALEAALWAFYHSTSFEDGALLAVNLGDDADTTGAIYGQLAGAHYSLHGIPLHWRERISHSELICRYADLLYEISILSTKPH